jgi:hypothetical protein
VQKKSCAIHRNRGNVPFLRRDRSGGAAIPPPWIWVNPIGNVNMTMKKKILRPDRIRRIKGGFSFIPHRFLSQGFLADLHQKEILLYLFLVLASDRNGLSFYSYDAICTLLELDLDQYINSRNGLIDKDLIAFDGTIFQVLDLPKNPVSSSAEKQTDGRSPSPPMDIVQLAGRVIKRMPS